MQVNISPKKSFRNLLIIILFLMTANTAGLISRLYLDHGNVFGLIDLFNVDREHNIPTIFSALLLIFSSILLYFISHWHKQERSAYISWLGLSVIFAFLSVDELASLHERLGRSFASAFELPGYFHFAWVVPYGILAILFGIVYLRFLLKIPRTTAGYFILAGIIYVGGAIGFEMISSWIVNMGMIYSLPYEITVGFEEFFEMLGVSIFIYALLQYIQSHCEGLEIKIG